MLDVGSTSSRETGGPAAILPLVGTEADLGAVLVRLARMAAAVHMAQATPPLSAPPRAADRLAGGVGGFGGGEG